MPKKAEPEDPLRKYSRKKDWKPEIIDDWPDEIPVSIDELELYELYLGDDLDRILGVKK